MQYYRGKFFIVFYENDDETFYRCFDNVREILQYQRDVMKKNVDINQRSIRTLNIALYHALRRDDHTTHMLGGTKRVYIVDTTEEA